MCIIVYKQNKFRIFVRHKRKTNIMTTLENTIEEILNSDLLNSIIEQEDKDLKEAGWTYEEIKSVAKMVTK